MGSSSERDLKISHGTTFHCYVSTLNKSNQAFALEDVITM